MLETILFFIVVLLANIIQGVTGFAGTILAMPFALMLVDYDTAVPVLNLLGLLSGVYVFVLNRKEVRWREIWRILVIMAPMIFVGIWLKQYLSQYGKLIYIILGVLVLVLAITGLLKMYGEEKHNMAMKAIGMGSSGHHHSKTGGVLIDFLLLVSSGLVHGMFVCGGPLLISYLTKRVKESGAFRATISTVWIVLNGLILATHIKTGLWTAPTVKTAVVTLPFLFGGMYIGGILYKKMSRKVFMYLTYILLIISGVSLLMK